MTTKVLHIIPDFGPGGAERMSVHLMRDLSRRDFKVAAISLFGRMGTDLEDLLAESKVPTWYLDKRPGPDPKMVPRIARVLKAFRPHVIHTHRHALSYALLPAFYYKVPVIVHTVHSMAEYDMAGNEIHKKAARLIHRVAFKRRVVPVAIAREVAQSLTSVYGVPEVSSVPNGIPVEAFGKPKVGRETWRTREGFGQENVLFVCLAGLRPVKNHSLLLEAFSQGPASTDPRAHLLLVGAGDLRDELEKKARTLGLGARVSFMGLRADIPEVLSAADVFVLSSDWEGNPLSVMEAMAAGIPVISTAVGGVPELVEEGKSGLLVPRGDVSALARAMSLLAKDRELRGDMGRAAYERAVQRFDLRAMTEAYANLYESALAKKLVSAERRRAGL